MSSKLKIGILIFGLINCCSVTVDAQKKGAASTSASASSASSSSGSGTNQLITGFHYKLKAFRQVNYKTLKPGTKQAAPNATVKVYERKIDFKTELKTSADPATPPSGVQYIGQLKVKSHSQKKQFIDYKATGINYISNDPVTVVANERQDKLDAINRFSNKKEWVSVTQGDSGKLVVQFYNRTQSSDQQEVSLTEEQQKRRVLQSIRFALYKDVTVSAGIPIAETDSAQNFFLKVKNKLLVRDPIYFISLPYAVYQYGATTIPFRLRFANSGKTINAQDASKKYNSVPSETTTSLSLAAYVGRKWGRTRFYYDASKSHNTVAFMTSWFGGVTSIALNNNNISEGHDLTTYPTQILAFSTGFSGTVEFGALNLGVFTGLDMPMQNVPWVYAYRPWIGFGIGFNLGMFNSAGNIGL